MKKITRIVGVDCKIGKNSRTGSTVTMGVLDEDIIACTEYFREFNSGNEIEGKIKKISLNLEYEDDLMEDEQAEKLIVNIDGALEDVTNGNAVILENTND